MWVQSVVLGAALFGLVLWAARPVLRWLRMHRIATKLPGPTSTLPVVGDAISFRGAPLEALMRLYKDHGTPCRVWVGPRLYVLLSHPDDAKAVLSSTAFVDRDDYMMEVLRPYTGNGLLAARGDDWRRRRKLLGRVYSAQWLKRQSRWLTAVSERLVSAVSASPPDADVQKQVAACTLDMVAGSVVGVDTQAVGRPTQGFTHDYMDAVQLLHFRVKNPALLMPQIFQLTKWGRKQAELIKEMHHFIDSAVETSAKKRSTKEDVNTEVHRQKDEVCDDTSDMLEGSALEAMMKLTDDSKLLREELATLLIAGQDTTATALCFILQLLALHPEVQEAAAEDEDVRDRVGREALRLFPPSPLISRELTTDIRLPSCGATLPAGCTVVVCALFTHRDAAFWPDPLTFDPDRFLPEACRERHPFAYLPFGAGPRSCIGAKYAHLQMQAALSKILPAFRVTTYGTRQDLEDLQMGMVISPKKGFSLHLTPRERNASCA